MKKLILGALLLLSTVSFGQTIENITFKGKVTNEFENSIKNCQVDFKVTSYSKMSLRDTARTYTDVNGEYSIIITVDRMKTHFIDVKCYCDNMNILSTRVISFKSTQDNTLNFRLSDKPITIDKYPTFVNKSAGDELKLYTKHFYTGTALTLAGGAIISISSSVAITNGADPTPGLVIGSLISIVGAGFIIEAPIHIKRAGIILNENGVGIKVKL
jgi:hypothetical protein